MVNKRLSADQEFALAEIYCKYHFELIPKNNTIENMKNLPGVWLRYTTEVENKMALGLTKKELQKKKQYWRVSVLILGSVIYV